MANNRGKTSSAKLANKSTNKRLKSKRRHKLDQRSAFKNVNLPVASQRRPAKLRGLRQEPSAILPNGGASSPDLHSGSDDEELGSFLSKHGHNLSFLESPLDREVSRKRKKLGAEDEPEAYEKAPRRPFEDKPRQTVHLLPIKSDTALIYRTVEKEPDSLGKQGSTTDHPVQTVVAPVVTDDAANMPRASVVELLAVQHRKVQQQKVQIAEISQEILESPERNISSLKKLLDMCKREEAMSVRKLSLLSLLEVFKDVIPSYPIRELTDVEKQVKVSKDVRQVRDFEDALLSNYQRYLQMLEEIINGCFSLKKGKPKKQPGANADIPKAVYNLGILATRSMADLLLTAPHFNFRTNIMACLVPKMELAGRFAEVGQICVDAVRSLFQNDAVGDVSLEVMKVINKLAKSKGVSLKAKVLEPLLSLRISADLLKSAQERGTKIERLQKKREALKRMSRKEKKRKKFEAQLDKELQEAEAVESREKRERIHTEILKFLFAIYFRVLKAARRSPLLVPTLQGLAKFAHLINVDFFDDVMACLKKLLTECELPAREALPCIQTGLRILSGQGESLAIDPRQFSTALYNVILQASSDASPDHRRICKECLEIVLIRRQKQVSLPLVQAFFKRLSTLALQQSAEDVLDSLAFVRNVLQVHRKCDNLLDNESFGHGAFAQDLHEPEHSNAESVCLWEMCLLCLHYQPQVKEYVMHILAGAPVTGPGSLPLQLLRRSTAAFSSESVCEDAEDISQYFPSTLAKTVSGKKASKSAPLDTTRTFTESVLKATEHLCDRDDLFQALRIVC